MDEIAPITMVSHGGLWFTIALPTLRSLNPYEWGLSTLLVAECPDLGKVCNKDLPRKQHQLKLPLEICYRSDSHISLL